MAIKLPAMNWIVASNPHFAKSTMDQVYFFVFVFGVNLAFWYEVFHVLPHYYAETTCTVAIHCLLAVSFYVGSLSNLYKLITTRTDCNLAVLSSFEHHEWPYCDCCFIYKPPRSHHCKICNVCIMSRDHHCWFSGCCIGHSNHRYYLSLILYMFSAAAYANAFHWKFAVEKLGHLGFAIPVCLPAPLVCALFGYLSFYEFLLSILTFLALICAVMFAWLLKIQVQQVIRGQTRYERKMAIEDYNNGLVQNIIAVMGKNWYVAWISPWISSPLPGNGITFSMSWIKTK